jgi:hypothetical protein
VRGVHAPAVARPAAAGQARQVIDAATVAGIRAEHRPVMRDPTCMCAGYECRYCRATWPCDAERWVRDDGHAPYGINDYHAGKV